MRKGIYMMAGEQGIPVAGTKYKCQNQPVEIFLHQLQPQKYLIDNI